MAYGSNDHRAFLRASDSGFELWGSGSEVSWGNPKTCMEEFHMISAPNTVHQLFSVSAIGQVAGWSNQPRMLFGLLHCGRDREVRTTVAVVQGFQACTPRVVPLDFGILFRESRGQHWLI